jgi:RNA polymerase sigma-70 factor (ECF subfamily)
VDVRRFGEDGGEAASDADLLRLDDADAFAVVYDRHAGAVFAWARARVGDYAEDLIAEVFARAWYGRRRFADQAGGSALPWLLGIAQHVLGDSLRKQRVECGARERLGLPPATAPEPGYDAVDERLSFPEAARRAIAALPEADRRLLQLRVIEDLPYRDIARRLRCTPVAARLRLSRALRRLHLALGGQRP